jgi:hypothetical protein
MQAGGYEIHAPILHQRSTRSTNPQAPVGCHRQLGPEGRTVSVDRVTVAQAAQRLGITKEAVRKRIHRGTIRSDKDQDGTVHVYVPPYGTPSGTDGEELVVELRDRVAYLERQVEEERNARYRADELLARLMERVQLEAPRDEPGSPETATEGEVKGGVPAEREEGDVATNAGGSALGNLAIPLGGIALSAILFAIGRLVESVLVLGVTITLSIIQDFLFARVGRWFGR